jgi:hypothetical protein
MGDPEIEAMSAVATIVADLEDAARGRVLRWAAERFGVTMPTSGRRGGGQGGVEGISTDEIAGEAPSYEHFAELFAAASPKTNEDKALVAAYWVQIHDGQNGWQSRRLNTELKHLGHAIPNITDALTKNIQRKPQRIIQLKKSGNSRQANKTYKITNEGIVYVQGMLSGGGN